MKKCIAALFLMLILPSLVSAAEMSTSVVFGSQYRPGRNYGFQIECSDVPAVTSSLFEWNGAINYTASGSYPNFYYNISNLAAGEYPYKWFVNNSTDATVFSNTFSIVKNSTLQISLTLDGTSGNKSYKNNTVAKFVVSLPITNKIVRLDTTYPGFTAQNNFTPMTYSLTLTQYGIFTATASWDGDENYTASSKAYRFDSRAPHISNLASVPESPVGYATGTNYKFQANIDDATLASVWFESNYTGSMKSYYANSNPGVQNSSGVFWIDLDTVGARTFSYRWHAKDSLNAETVTNYTNYRILKMTPLVMELLPSTNIREGTQVTANCFSINPTELDASKFSFYKNSEKIGNISSSARLGVFLMTYGNHSFTCSTNGTGNYSNQTITRFVDVLSAPPQQENVTGEMIVENVKFPSVEAGKSGEASFDIRNDMLKNIVNLTVSLSGIPSNWYAINIPAYIYRGETGTVRMRISVPIDAESKSYPVKINIVGYKSDGNSVAVEKNYNLKVTGIGLNRPPSYFSGYTSSEIAGAETSFALNWHDDKGLSGFIFSSNISGTWKNESWESMTGTDGIFNVTRHLSSEAGSAVAWKIYANDSNGEWSASEEYLVLTKPAPLPDLTIVIAVATVFILAVVIILIFVRKTKETEYVYNMDDLNEQD